VYILPQEFFNLCRHGLLIGPSTGFNLQGLFKSLLHKKESRELDSLRNEGGIINVVVIACDTPFPYFDDYFYYLDNEELLLINDKDPQDVDKDVEISINQFII
jgi:hypothetical protein